MATVVTYDNGAILVNVGGRPRASILDPVHSTDCPDSPASHIPKSEFVSPWANGTFGVWGSNDNSIQNKTEWPNDGKAQVTVRTSKKQAPVYLLLKQFKQGCFACSIQYWLKQIPLDSVSVPVPTDSSTMLDAGPNVSAIAFRASSKHPDHSTIVRRR